MIKRFNTDRSPPNANRIAIVALIPDLGHVIPLLRVGVVLQNAGYVVRAFLPEEVLDKARENDLLCVSLGPFLSEEALLARSTFLASKYRHRFEYGNGELYSRAVEVRALEVMPELKKQLRAFSPSTLLTDYCRLEHLFTALGRELSVPLVLNMSWGTHFAFLDCPDKLRRVMNLLRMQLGPFVCYFGISKHLHLGRRLFYYLSLLCLPIFITWRWLRYFRWSRERRLEREAKRLYERSFRGFEPLTFDEYKEAGGEVVSINCGLVPLEQARFGVHCPPLYEGVRVFGPVLPLTDSVISDDLMEWIDEMGEKPIIYVSFGTMVVVDDHVCELVLALAHHLEIGIIWSVPERSRRWNADKIGTHRSVRFEYSVDQRQLLTLPQVRLCINHGGIGTLQECMIAGKPVITIPCLFDQFYNASLVEQLGIGLQLKWMTLTERRLIRSVEQVLSESQFASSAEDVKRQLEQQVNYRSIVNCFNEIVRSDQPLPAREREPVDGIRF